MNPVIFYLSKKSNNEEQDKTKQANCGTLALLLCGKFKDQTSKQLK
jgi:hypothetical protein